MKRRSKDKAVFKITVIQFEMLCSLAETYTLLKKYTFSIFRIEQLANQNQLAFIVTAIKISDLTEGRLISSFCQIKTRTNQVRPQACDSASLNVHTHILLDMFLRLILVEQKRFRT
jgi:hypothetical protein